MWGAGHNSLGEAALFMKEVREAQLHGGKSLRGRLRISTEQRQAIQVISISNPVIIGLREELNVDRKSVDSLYERFEEMCRRQKKPINKNMRPAILERLTLELWLNQKALNAPAVRLISATLYNGAIGWELMEQFPDFSDSPSLFVYVLENHPSAPVEFLTKVRGIVTELKNEDEFKDFPPHTIKYAAVNKPQDPRAFLRKVRNAVAGILHEKEFRPLENMRSAVLRAAVTAPQKSRSVLRKKIKNKDRKK